jgi:hypothetical protein
MYRIKSQKEQLVNPQQAFVLHSFRIHLQKRTLKQFVWQVLSGERISPISLSGAIALTTPSSITLLGNHKPTA